MPSKTSFFNRGIFLNNIKRFWLVTFSYTFFLLLFIVGVLNSEISRLNSASGLDTLNVGNNIFSQSNGLMALFLGFYPLVAALAVFSYMQFPKNTAMVHSLPVRRETLFVTNYISGLFITTFPLIFNSLVLIIAEAIAGFPSLTYAWMWIGINLVLTFLMYTFAVFSGMFTGHMAAQAIFFYIFNFLAIFLESIADMVLNNFLFGYVSGSRGSPQFEAWSPLFHAGSTLYSDFANGENNVSALIGYVIAGIIFLVSSFFLYRKRHMEVATDIISFPVVKPIFKYSAAFCSSALLGTIMVSVLNVQQNLAAYVITYLIGGFIGYFASEMLLRKTFRVFKSYKGFLVFGLVLSLLLSSISFDLFGYERHVPQDSDVELMCLFQYMDSRARLALRPEDYDPDEHRYVINYYKDPPQVLTDDQVKELRKELQGIIENREAITMARQIHSYIVENEAIFKENGVNLRNRTESVESNNDFQNRNLYFGYRLKNGTLVERSYNLTTYKNNTELDQLLGDYLSIPGVRERYEPVLGKTATDIRSIMIHFSSKDGQYNSFEITENVQDFLTAYQKDIMAQDPLESMFRTSEKMLYNIDIGFEFRNNEFFDLPQTSYSQSLYSNFTNTMEYLIQKGIIDTANLQTSEYDMKTTPAAARY